MAQQLPVKSPVLVTTVPCCPGVLYLSHRLFVAYTLTSSVLQLQVGLAPDCRRQLQERLP